MNVHEAYALGVEARKKINKKLYGTHWRIDVWENLGWHVALRKSGMNVDITKYPTHGVYYGTLLSLNNTIGGEMYLSTNNYRSKDINMVLAKQLGKLKRHIKQATSVAKRVVK